MNYLEIYEDFIAENRFHSMVQQGRIYRVLVQLENENTVSNETLSLKSLNPTNENLNSNSSFQMSEFEVKVSLPKLSITEQMREKKARRELKLK